MIRNPNHAARNDRRHQFNFKLINSIFNPDKIIFRSIFINFVLAVDLERQFTGLREQLYKERLSQVDFQLSEVRGGRSREYLGPLQRLQEKMRSRIEVAGVLRKMRLENIQNKYDAEKQAALQNMAVSIIF